MGWVKRGRRTTKALIGVHGLTGIKALLLSYSIISYHILRCWAVGIKNALQPRVHQTQQSCNAGGVPKDARCSRSILPNKTYPFCLKVTCKNVDAVLDMRNAQWGFTNSWNLLEVSGSAGRIISVPSLYKPSAYTPNYTIYRIYLPNDCLNCYRTPWSVRLYVTLQTATLSILLASLAPCCWGSKTVVARTEQKWSAGKPKRKDIVDVDSAIQCSLHFHWIAVICQAPSAEERRDTNPATHNWKNCNMSNFHQFPVSSAK